MQSSLSTQQLFPEIRLVLGFMSGCHWCDKMKETLPMIASLGIRHQIVTNEQHLDAYEADEYGYPFIAVCDKKGYPLQKHGGYLTLSELLELIDTTYDEHYPDQSKNNG